MKVEIDRDGDVTILRPNGRLDALSAPMFSEAISSVLEEEHPQLILDMTSAPYISSAGLRVVIQMAKQITGRGKLAACCLSPNVREVFVMAGFDRLMPLCDDVEHARQQIA